MKNILVTGGAGFIGSHLVEKLVQEKSNQVVVVDDFNDYYSPAIKRDNIKNVVGLENFKLFETDICDVAGLREAFEYKTPDVIIHLAARAGVRPSLEQPALYTQTNVAGTVNLLELAREFGVKQFIFGSSSSVYGSSATIPFNENERIQSPISPYAATKAAGEMICHTYSHLYDIQIVCLRFFTVYGARQRPDLAIHKFAGLISAGTPIPVYGDGSTKRDYTYVDDIISGILKSLEYRQSAFEIFNLGESETIRLSELIEQLEESLGKKAIIKRLPLQPGDMTETYADITKARNLLGYDPHTSFAEGIGKFVEWFKGTSG
jgi:UDP-glucuronate 4-epimerase